MTQRRLAESQTNYGVASISRPATQDGARPVLFWFLFFLTALIFGIALAYATDPMTTRHWRNVSIAFSVAGFVALLVLIYRMIVHDGLQRVIVEYYEPDEALAAPAFEPDKKELQIKTTRGTVVIVQPRPGAFAAWLRDVTNPDNKTQFSGNEAKRREWEDWQYINLVAQLKGIGWLHAERRFNGAPDIDSAHLNEMREWLKTPLL